MQTSPPALVSQEDATEESAALRINARQLKSQMPRLKWSLLFRFARATKPQSSIVQALLVTETASFRVLSRYTYGAEMGARSRRQCLTNQCRLRKLQSMAETAAMGALPPFVRKGPERPLPGKAKICVNGGNGGAELPSARPCRNVCSRRRQSLPQRPEGGRIAVKR